jgi:hypothetical protein
VDSAQVLLSIIIPTAGRPTLATLAPQLHADDQALVVGDGEQPLDRELVDGLPTPPWWYFEHGPTWDTGRSPCYLHQPVGRHTPRRQGVQNPCRDQRRTTRAAEGSATSYALDGY